MILAGRSGTGKSGLVRLYGETLGLSPSQIAFLPVRPSWMDDGDILGYLDRNRMLYFPSDTGLAELLVEASRHPEKMYIVCFDEMNLARAEYYFAQFISVLEKKENPALQLYNPSLEERVYNHSDYPARIPLMDNVLFMGTVNVDESTYHFSDKILDRANVITLHQRKFSDMARLTRREVAPEVEVSADEYRQFRKDEGVVTLSDEELHLLDDLNAALDERGTSGGIGYRVVSDMSRYLANIPSGSPMNRKEALDMQIVQRVLTKVRGSREQIGYLTSLNEENKLIGRFPELLKMYSQVSAFTESLRVLERKAKELRTMSTPFKLTVFCRRDFPEGCRVTEFIPSIKELMDGEQEPALVFSENQDVNLRFSAPDGFRFTMDGLDIFNADGEQDEEGQTWLTPQGGRVFSLFEGQNFPLVPGYYIMTVTGEGKSWHSLVEVTPRFLEKESWKDMKKELTKEIRHLSFDFMCRHVHMDRYHGNLAGMDSRMLLRFYIIDDMFPQVFRALEELAHTANSRIAWKHRFLSRKARESMLPSRIRIPGQGKIVTARWCRSRKSHGTWRKIASPVEFWRNWLKASALFPMNWSG